MRRSSRKHRRRRRYRRSPSRSRRAAKASRRSRRRCPRWRRTSGRRGFRRWSASPTAPRPCSRPRTSGPRRLTCFGTRAPCPISRTSEWRCCWPLPARPSARRIWTWRRASSTRRWRSWRMRPACCGRGRGSPRGRGDFEGAHEVWARLATAAETQDQRTFYGALSAEWTLARLGTLSAAARDAVPAGPARALAVAEAALVAGATDEVATALEEAGGPCLGRSGPCCSRRCPLLRDGGRSGAGGGPCVRSRRSSIPGRRRRSSAGCGMPRVPGSARARTSTPTSLASSPPRRGSLAPSDALPPVSPAGAGTRRSPGHSSPAATRDGRGRARSCRPRGRKRRAARRRQPGSPPRRRRGRGRCRDPRLAGGLEPGAPGRGGSRPGGSGARHRRQPGCRSARPHRRGDRRVPGRRGRSGAARGGARAVATGRSGAAGRGGAAPGGGARGDRRGRGRARGPCRSTDRNRGSAWLRAVLDRRGRGRARGAASGCGCDARLRRGDLGGKPAFDGAASLRRRAPRCRGSPASAR